MVILDQSPLPQLPLHNLWTDPYMLEGLDTCQGDGIPSSDTGMPKSSESLQHIGRGASGRP